MTSRSETTMTPLEILTARRRAQLSGEGLGAEEAQALAKALPKPRVSSYRPKTVRLHVTSHASKRMSQRSVSMRQVSLIYRFGASAPAADGCMAYQIRRDMLRDCVPKVFHGDVKPVLDVTIVVAAGGETTRPAVVTVIRGEAYAAEW